MSPSMSASRRRRRLTSATATPIATRIGNQYFLLASSAASQPGTDQSGRSRSGQGRSGRSGRSGRGMRGRCQSGSQPQSRSRTKPRAIRASSRPATTWVVATTTWRAAYRRGCRCAQTSRRCALVPVGGSKTMRSGREVGAPPAGGYDEPGGAVARSRRDDHDGGVLETGSEVIDRDAQHGPALPPSDLDAVDLERDVRAEAGARHPRDEVVPSEVEGVDLSGHEVIIEYAL